MRYVIGIIAGVVLIMGAVGGMENDTLNITYSLKMMVIGVILIYECYKFVAKTHTLACGMKATFYLTYT